MATFGGYSTENFGHVWLGFDWNLAFGRDVARNVVAFGWLLAGNLTMFSWDLTGN